MATHSYDRGGQPDGTLGVSIEAFYGDETVAIELDHGDSAAHLTADQARALAADLLTHANQLSKPSDEELIRDAMTEATDHPGRIVQWAQNTAMGAPMVASGEAIRVDDIC